MLVSAITRLKKEERQLAVLELGRRAMAPPNGQAARLEQRIHAFESAHGMTSDEMRQRFARGEIKDTADIASWLLLLRACER